MLLLRSVVLPKVSRRLGMEQDFTCRSDTTPSACLGCQDMCVSVPIPRPKLKVREDPREGREWPICEGQMSKGVDQEQERRVRAVMNPGEPETWCQFQLPSQDLTEAYAQVGCVRVQPATLLPAVRSDLSYCPAHKLQTLSNDSLRLDNGDR